MQKSSLVASLDLKLFEAVDRSGEIRMRNLTTWNHMTCGKLQTGLYEGYRPKMKRRARWMKVHRVRLFVYSRFAHTAPTIPAARLTRENMG